MTLSKNLLSFTDELEPAAKDLIWRQSCKKQMDQTWMFDESVERADTHQKYLLGTALLSNGCGTSVHIGLYFRDQVELGADDQNWDLQVNVRLMRSMIFGDN